MSRAAGEAIYRLDRMIDEIVELRKLLQDIEAQGRGENPPPRPRAPAVAPAPYGSPAPATIGEIQDRAATKQDLQLLRSVAKHAGITETDLDAMVQRRTGKPRWNMLSKKEVVHTRQAIEGGER